MHLYRLLDACSRNQIDMVQRTLCDSANVNNVHVHNDAPVRIAVACGHAKLVHTLVVHGANVSVNDNALLVLAARTGDVQMVRVLLECGADACARHNAPLLAAFQHQQWLVACVLLEHGARQTWAANGTATSRHVFMAEQCMMHIIEHGTLAQLHCVLERTCARPSANDNEPLRLAASLGHVHMVRTLMAQHADVDARVRNDEAVLLAASAGHEYMVRFLVECGHCDVRTHGCAAVRMAASNGHGSVVRYCVSFQRRVSSPFSRAELESFAHAAKLNGHAHIDQYVQGMMTTTTTTMLV